MSADRRTRKPDHLGPEYGAQFSDASVAAHYRFRPPYPDEVFDALQRLIVDQPRVLLDVGTGTGAIARRMAGHVERVDAVDPSSVMIAGARNLPGGDSEGITWITGFAETAPLNPPYSLITAGASLHWMEWWVALPRFRDALTPHGALAIVENHVVDVPWAAPLGEIIPRYSTNRDFRPYDVVEELETRALFRTLGWTKTAPMRFQQPVADYVASFHARNGFSLDRMNPTSARAFDREVQEIVGPYESEGQVELQIVGEITWGIPAPLS